LFNNKDILITGGTGSFGKKCTEMILKLYKPKRLIIFSRDEFKQSEMMKVFPESQYPIRYFLGDIRDKERLYRAFAGVDYVIHAAALKQVPALEYNPFEAVKTNIIGAQNIIEAAIEHRVKKVIALSTDKAVGPINLYGATKLCSDKLFLAGNAYVGKAPTKFSIVRYGNVVGSRGSVIPLFLQQKTRGVLTLTDDRMTRFWISIEKGVDFVLNCLEHMNGRELFIPKMPSTSVTEIAKAICPECKIDIIGIRPGEKLHEVLIPKDEARNTLEFKNHYIVKPSIVFSERQRKINGGMPVGEDFEYNSETNPWHLTASELKKIIDTALKIL
jgi:UDP-N-acetylglucosamine 4,6-dehydratase